MYTIFSQKRLLEELDEEELIEVANTSYAYWYVASKAAEQMPQAARENAALKEIWRHWCGEGKNYDKTLVALREALNYRKVRCSCGIQLKFSHSVHA
jgi:hypothetical protein